MCTLVFTKSIYSMQEHLAVRIDYDIPTQEKEYLKKRKVITAQALKKTLGLSAPLQSKEVKCPNRQTSAVSEFL